MLRRLFFDVRESHTKSTKKHHNAYNRRVSFRNNYCTYLPGVDSRKTTVRNEDVRTNERTRPRVSHYRRDRHHVIALDSRPVCTGVLVPRVNYRTRNDAVFVFDGATAKRRVSTRPNDVLVVTELAKTRYTKHGTGRVIDPKPIIVFSIDIFVYST